ncbi:hypothetical protein HPB52_000070 [Rhipicephalus sanguineus]|uniref:Transposase n=1 Tax=Rhipicephalus sanguineus TaxID=34632 RepID=A0A9D4PPZ4_RHISA|nr:hypothetical protein HPB52_000070 [Rhipicephalus sanguineus]
MEDRDTRRPGRPRKAPDEQKKKYARVSPVDRCRIIDVHRRGGDLKVLSETLGINIKTVRSIAATDRDTAKTRGGSSKKFGPDVVDALQQIVQENPSFTLEQIKRALKEEMPNIEVSTSTIDRLLDGHGYSVKLLTQRPVDRNRADVKQLRRRYAQWLQSEGTTQQRYYIDETNFNVWCSRSFGRAKRGAPACRLSTSAKGANINVIACMSANGLVHWTIADKVHWAVFNDFLAEVRRTRLHEVCLTVFRVTRHLLGNPSLSASTTRYASTTISQEHCCLYHTPRYAGPKLLLSDRKKQALTRALRHCTQCTVKGSQARTTPCVVVMRTSSTSFGAAPLLRVRARAVRFNLMVPEWV